MPMTDAAIAMDRNAASEVAQRGLANALRALSMDAIQRANSGHPGMPMGMADVAAVLFTRFLKFDASAPDWPDRDRFVLSAGHGSMLLYSLLYLTGYPGMDTGQLKAFRQLGSMTAGHPEYGHAPGIETTTGPLGQGLGNAVGMALAERLLNARHGDEIVDHYTYAMAGDGCLMEGIAQEAISLAGHLKLNRLIVLWDDNQISIDGPTGLTVSDDQLKRFEASGWDARAVDGHDPDAVAAAIEAARVSDRPSLIACKTIIGYGAPSKQGTAATHGAPLGDDEIAAARLALEWPSPPFEVPEDILNTWRGAGLRGAPGREAWEARAQKSLGSRELARLGDPIDAEAAKAISAAVAELKEDFASQKPKLATRVSSQQALEKLVPVVPGIIGGSADLTGSVGTLTSHHCDVVPGDYSGSSNSAAVGQQKESSNSAAAGQQKGSSNSAAAGQIKSPYLRYGVREHGMAAAMNGMALHGGIVPYGATFLVFTDYCRPSIRLSALMGIRVIYVMTHDSIGLGEDGPTHQPVEHLASLRAMPNLNVLRPADATECAECWEIALTSANTPSILALTRQGVPALRMADTMASSAWLLTA